jgi:hypothetical protein
MIEVSDDLDVESPRFEQQQERESTTMSYPTIFGGQAELSKAVADILGFQGQYALASREEAISTLWRWAFDYGAKLHLRRSTEHWQADLYLEPSPSATGLDDNIIPLAQLLAKSKGRREQWARKTASQEKLLRAAAIEIHRLYGIENYEKECLIPELLATSALVKFAMTVGALHHITHSDGAEMFAYAINSEWLQDGNLMLWDLLAKATGNGIGTMCLILAASALWTGTTADAAYPMSQRNRVRVGPNSIYETAADRTVLGKVGPHGVVILEIIRNPVEFSFHGLSKPIIFFSRGSVPLLGLDTRDGYIITSERRILRKTHGVKLQSKMAQDSDLDAVRYPDPVITVEPDTSDDLKSTIICAWYGGDLAFEIDPLVALLNVSKLATNLGKPLLPKMRIFKEEMRDFREPEDVGRGNMELGAPQNEVYAREPKRFPPQSLTPLDFLKKRAVIIKEGSAVFKTYSSSWLLCAAGLVPPHSVSVTRERLNYQDVLLDEGQVIIEFIPRKE